MLGVEKAAAGTTNWKGFFRIPPAASQPSRLQRTAAAPDHCTAQGTGRASACCQMVTPHLMGESFQTRFPFLAPGLPQQGSLPDQLQIKPKETQQALPPEPQCEACSMSLLRAQSLHHICNLSAQPPSPT